MKTRLFYWIPRILAIVSILFMAMFSLDAFEGKESIGKKLSGLLIHNIPALILIGVLILAWKREVAGGILFLIVFLAGALFFDSFTGNPASLIVISPFFLAGVLFIVNGLFFRIKSISQ